VLLSTYEVEGEIGQSPTGFRADKGYHSKEGFEGNDNEYGGGPSA
jgi:hypothetical protein